MLLHMTLTKTLLMVNRVL